MEKSKVAGPLRIIALDVGLKRVGVAVSDPLGLGAQPLKVLPRRPHADFLKALGRLIAEYGADFVLLGLPLRAEGETGPEAQRILALAREIRIKLNVETVTWDERFSTVEAEEILLEADLSRAKRRSVIDKTAAAIILDDYMRHIKMRDIQHDRQRTE